MDIENKPKTSCTHILKSGKNKGYACNKYDCKKHTGTICNYILKNDKMIINFEPINLFGLSLNKSVEQYSFEFKYINNNVVVVRYTGNTGQSTYVIFKILQ